MTDLLPLVFTSGWASGVNAYAVVLVLGLLGRFAGVDVVPSALQSDAVLIGAAVLYALEFVADKIPWLDSTWDAVHTAIRPTIGAALGLLLAGEAGTVVQALAAAGGGLTALASHAVKAGVRAGVNTSPEPVSNIAVSVAEDVTAAGVMALEAVLDTVTFSTPVYAWYVTVGLATAPLDTLTAIVRSVEAPINP